MGNEVNNPRRASVSGAAKRLRELRDRLRNRGTTGTTAPKPGGETTVTKDVEEPEDEQ
jgi:hypothetical protein